MIWESGGTVGIALVYETGNSGNTVVTVEYELTAAQIAAVSWNSFARSMSTMAIPRQARPLLSTSTARWLATNLVIWIPIGPAPMAGLLELLREVLRQAEVIRL